MSINHAVENLAHAKDYLIFSAYQRFHTPKRFKSLGEAQAKVIFSPKNLQLALKAFDVEGNKLLHRTKIEMKQRKKDKSLSAEEWIKARDLPEELINFPEFTDFIRTGHIANIMRYFGDSIVFKNEQPALLVNDRLTTAQEILDTFELKIIDGDFRIVHRETGKVWSYFRDGLIEHNPMQEFRILDVLPPNERPEQPMLEVSFLKEGHTNSAGGLKKYDRHTFVKLYHPDGSVISFGRLGRGMSCPDPHEFLNIKREKTRHPITQEDFDVILEIAKETQSSKHQTYNLLDDNCGTFACKIANVSIQDPHLTGRTTLKEQNTFEHRVKVYVYAQELAKDLKTGRTTEKLKALLAQYPQLINDKVVPSIINSTDIDFNTKMVLSALLLNPSLHRNVDQQISDLIAEVEESSEDDLTEKVYNLFTDVYSVHEETVVDHPSLFHSRLAALSRENDDANLIWAI